MTYKSQREKVLERLKSGRPITPLQAFYWYGSLRLGAIIHKLRKNGYPEIKTRMIKVSKHKRVARYSL